MKRKQQRVFRLILPFALGALVATIALASVPVSKLLAHAADQTITPSDDARVISVVHDASPAVVSIVATKELPIINNNSPDPLQEFCSDPPFRQYFEEECLLNQQTSQSSATVTAQEVAAGTGFIVSPDGLIVTNKHVVNISGATYTAIANDNRRYPATVLMKDPNQDIAILKIDALNLPTVNLGDSNQIAIGQTAIAIGNALGQFSNTVSKGIVSGLARSVQAVESSGGSEQLDQVIQTDAAINLGNSGGPLLNLNGQVIGINTAIVQGAQNIGFAIPINNARTDINQVSH